MSTRRLTPTLTGRWRAWCSSPEFLIGAWLNSFLVAMLVDGTQPALLFLALACGTLLVILLTAGKPARFVIGPVATWGTMLLLGSIILGYAANLGRYEPYFILANFTSLVLALGMAYLVATRLTLDFERVLVFHSAIAMLLLPIPLINGEVVWGRLTPSLHPNFVGMIAMLTFIGALAIPRQAMKWFRAAGHYGSHARGVVPWRHARILCSRRMLFVVPPRRAGRAGECRAKPTHRSGRPARWCGRLGPFGLRRAMGDAGLGEHTQAERPAPRNNHGRIRPDRALGSRPRLVGGTALPGRWIQGARAPDAEWMAGPQRLPGPAGRNRRVGIRRLPDDLRLCDCWPSFGCATTRRTRSALPWWRATWCTASSRRGP